MSESRPKGGRAASRAFRPALDGLLEDRVLMSVANIQKDLAYSAYLLKHPSARHGLPAPQAAAIAACAPFPCTCTQTGRRGRDPDRPGWPKRGGQRRWQPLYGQPLVYVQHAGD